MEYTVIYRMYPSLKEFIAEVNKLIQEGWRPLGGVSVSDGRYAQALTRSKP